MDSEIHTEPGAKDLFRLILHSPPLLIATLAGAGLVVFLLIRNSPKATTTAPAVSGAISSQTPAGASTVYILDGTGPQGYGPGTSGTITQTAPPPSQAQTAVPPPEMFGPVLKTPAQLIQTPQPLPTATIPATNPQNAAPQRTYTIQSGDTLSKIASQFGTTWQNLYQSNQSTIVNTANQHGNPVPGGAQNNIFPGEVLNIP